MLTISNKILLAGMLLSTVTSAFGQSFSGKTQWAEIYNLSSYVSSSVAKIMVTEGQKIREGDALIKMDDTLLLLDYKIAKSQLESVSPQKQKADLDLNRALELYDRTLITDVTLKNAEFIFAEAKAKFDSATAILDKAKFLLQAANIKSPINGRILSINTSEGFYANTDDAVSLLTLVNDNVMHAIAYLKVSQWSPKLINKKATITINEMKYKGVVESLSLMPLENSKGLSVYPIIISFEPKSLIPAGMPLTIDIK